MIEFMQTIQPFNFDKIILQPWLQHGSTYVWIFLMGFLVTTACGLVGNFLLLRRMSLVGDAISHSVLPGLAIAFLFSGSRQSLPMFIGALIAALVTTMIIEVIHSKTHIKKDAAISIAFTSLFAVGVILISLFASRIDLDQDCVLYGEIAFVGLDEPLQMAGLDIGPLPVVRMAIIALLTALLIFLFYKELLVNSFDANLGAALGIPPKAVHYGLMSWLAIVIVSAFESVGAILVVAMLIIPGATASMLAKRLPIILLITVVHALLSSLLGMHLAIWLDASFAACMVVMATLLFILAWLVNPELNPIFRKFGRPTSLSDLGHEGGNVC